MNCLALSGVMLLAGSMQAQKKAFGSPKIIMGARAFPGSVAVADFDLDGKGDVAVANAFALDLSNGPASIGFLDRNFAITKTENLPSTREAGFFSYPAIAAADMDRDGLEDVILMSDRGAVSLLLNDSARDSRSTQPRFSLTTPARRIRLMAKRSNQFFYLQNNGFLVDDFDGDGDRDLVFAAEMTFLNDVQGYTGIILLRGDGKGGFKEEENLLFADIISLDQGDVDGDKKQDLVALSRTGQIHILRSLGGGKYDKTSWLCSSPTYPLIIALGDADGDGRDDILVGGGKTKAQASLYYAGPKVTWTTRTNFDQEMATANRCESMVFEDLDGDEKADIAILLSRHSGDAMLHIYTAAARATPNRQEFTLPATLDPGTRVPARSMLKALDFDGDLNPELIVGSLTTRLTQKLVQFVFPNLTPKIKGRRFYGKGQVTSAGVVPAIASFGGRPALGNPDWGVSVTGTKYGRRRAALMLYHHPGGPWKGPGFEINVFPRWNIPVMTNGAGPRGGHALIRLGIPRDPYLLSLTFYFQWLVEDPEALSSSGIAVSEAMAVKFVAK